MISLVSFNGGLSSAAIAVALCPAIANAVIIEDWQFEDASGTALPALTNDAAGGASWSGAATNAVADGSGNLELTVGADGSDNVFRNASSVDRNIASGIVTLEFAIPSATIAGGDASGANVGFGLRDAGTNSDIFIVRLQRQNDGLTLQTRANPGAGFVNQTLENFGVTSITDLAVRVEADLDADTIDVFWTLGAGAEQSSLGIAVADVEYDWARMSANTNTADWGSTDVVDVSSLRISHVVPEPASAMLVLAGATAIGLRRRR